MSDQVTRGEFVGVQKDIEFNKTVINENKERLALKANKEDINDLKDKLDDKSSKSDVSLLQKIVFGTVATILAAFLAAIIQLVI